MCLKVLAIPKTHKVMFNAHNVLKKNLLFVMYEIANNVAIPKSINLSKIHNVHAASSLIISKYIYAINKDIAHKVKPTVSNLISLNISIL